MPLLLELTAEAAAEDEEAFDPRPKKESMPFERTPAALWLSAPLRLGAGAVILGCCVVAFLSVGNL
jgi:hypothetical protein